MHHHVFTVVVTVHSPLEQTVVSSAPRSLVLTGNDQNRETGASSSQPHGHLLREQEQVDGRGGRDCRAGRALSRSGPRGHPSATVIDLLASYIGPSAVLINMRPSTTPSTPEAEQARWGRIAKETAPGMMFRINVLQPNISLFPLLKPGRIRMPDRLSLETS